LTLDWNEISEVAVMEQHPRFFIDLHHQIADWEDGVRHSRRVFPDLIRILGMRRTNILRLG
jgi:hypothetical protein